MKAGDNYFFPGGGARGKAKILQNIRQNICQKGTKYTKIKQNIFPPYTRGGTTLMPPTSAPALIGMVIGQCNPQNKP